MSFDFSIVGDHIVSHLGEPATFTPTSGPPVECSVLFRSPDVSSSFASVGFVSEAPHIRVLYREVVYPAKGSRFTVGGVEYVVTSEPTIDAHSDLWDCPVART